MSAGNNRDDSTPPGNGVADCSLSDSEQTRNLILFGCNKSLVYLGAPVLYVSITQPAFLEALGASKTICNLPSTVYFWATPFPILIAWFFPKVRTLKPVLFWSYMLMAGIGAMVTVTLLLPTPRWAAELLQAYAARIPDELSYLRLPLDWAAPAVILHSAILGFALGVVATFEWEVLGRGVSVSRRGQALGLAFGVGPILALIASLASQAVLDGIEKPWSFAILFAWTAPLMALGGLLATRFVVNYPAIEVDRKPFLESVFGGIGDFLSNRLILITAIALILLTAGYNIFPNLTLYTRIATGQPAEEFAGFQNALRFGFKIVAGLFLGWLLTRTNPKAGLLVTGGFCLAGVMWALVAPGMLFLVSFGFMGAGELLGVYYPNYIMMCSAPSKIRRNMAFTSMLNMPCGFAAVLFGLIADEVSLRASFLVSAAMLMVVLLLVQVGLPPRPRPRENTEEE